MEKDQAGYRGGGMLMKLYIRCSGKALGGSNIDIGTRRKKGSRSRGHLGEEHPRQSERSEARAFH